MDKRTLSKIPREPADAEMLDIAGRLGGKMFIATSQLVCDNKILLLTFYRVDELKKGKTEAEFRTFLSEDDYITQDLTVSKIKWLTASFYGMSRFCLVEAHWDYKAQQYIHEERIFIRSNKEKKQIAEFFKDYAEGRSHTCEPWNSVMRFQDNVLDRKLAERHAKELKIVDEAMKPFKEVPKEFFDWCWETGMSFSRYVLYKEIKKGTAECECTYCKKRGIVDRNEVRLRNNEKDSCPFCNSPVTFKARGKLAAQNYSERWFAYIERTDEGFAIRYFQFRRNLRNDAYRGFEKNIVEEHVWEAERDICYFENNELKSKDYEWGVYKQRGKDRWCPAGDRCYPYECILYPGNLPEAWEHTPLKYSGLEYLARKAPTTAINYEKGMHTYLKFQKLEWICKMGLTNLADHIIDSHGGRYATGVSHINYKGDTIYDILRLTKLNTRTLQEINGGDYELRLLQVAEKLDIHLKPEILRDYYSIFECNTELLNPNNRNATLYKIIKYVSKESEGYPIGDAGYGCRYRYSYMRYTERPDPRLERKRNLAHDWLEYLKWCKELKYDTSNMFIYFPKNFKKVHDRTAREYQAMQDKKAAAEKRRRERAAARELAEVQRKMEDIFKANDGVDAFSIKGFGLVLVVPKTGAEIKAEGEQLHHCVGTYIDKVAKGQTNIFFIRKENEPDKSYYTMEWNDNRIVQCRGKNNCAMTREVKAFTQAFEKKMLEAAGRDKKRKERKNALSA